MAIASDAYAVSLGTKSPGMLPTSPFYFLKEWRRGIIRSFVSRDPLSEVVYELDVLDEKAAELRKVSELSPENNKAILEALESYKNSQAKLKGTLKSIDISAIKESKKERLVEEVMKRVSGHEVYLSSFSKTYADHKDLVDVAEKAQEFSFEVLEASRVIPEDKFEGIAKEYLTESSAQRMILNTDEIPTSQNASSSELIENKNNTTQVATTTDTQVLDENPIKKSENQNQ
jgi:hypothetical protein